MNPTTKTALWIGGGLALGFIVWKFLKPNAYGSVAAPLMLTPSIPDSGYVVPPTIGPPLEAAAWQAIQDKGGSKSFVKDVFLQKLRLQGIIK